MIPVFQREADEATWWDEHLDDVEHDFADAMEAGTTRVLTGEALNQRVRWSLKGVGSGGPQD
jgi:hypothetical protein